MTVFRSKFFWRLFASFAAVLAVAGFLTDRMLANRLEGSLAAGLEQQLREASLLLDPYVRRCFETRESAELRTEIAELGRSVDLRLTLIRPDGSVLADSDEDPTLMENHGARPEVLQALREGTGTSRRFSRTLGIRMLYHARRVSAPPAEGAEAPAGAPVVGVVRLAVSLQQLEEQVRATRAKLALGLGLGLLFALALGAMLARRTTAPIVAMTRAAEAIRDGRFETPIPRVPQDEIGILAGTLHDLGDQVARRIATISQEDAQLRAMLAGMVEGVVAVDDRDRVLFSNEAAGRLLGLDQDPGERRLWEQAPIAGLEELIAAARDQRCARRREIELHRNGRELVLDAQASPFQGGERGGVVVVVHDVSELRRLEGIRRDFVANVSHELKTPLASIKGFVETLLGGALYDQENNQRFLERIDANVDRLSYLVSDLLSLARIENQGDAVEKRPVAWDGVIEGVLRRHADAAERKGLELRVSPTKERVAVLGDPEAMTQVLENLTDNAIKYTPEGRVEISVRVEGHWGVLSVRDTGFGVPAADQGRIFERFYRVDKARSRELGGTGLGLSIVKHLVLSMNGDVSVASEPGQGSTFEVRLPLAN